MVRLIRQRERALHLRRSVLGKACQVFSCSRINRFVWHVELLSMTLQKAIANRRLRDALPNCGFADVALSSELVNTGRRPDL